MRRRKACVKVRDMLVSCKGALSLKQGGTAERIFALDLYTQVKGFLIIIKKKGDMKNVRNSVQNLS